MPTHASEVALSNGADDDEAYEGEAMVAHAAEYGGPTGSPSGKHPDDEPDVGYAFTKDSTAKQSISAWDNYKESSLSFDRIHTARRDANSAIGAYVARVAGISLQDKADHMAKVDRNRVSSSPSRDSSSFFDYSRGSDIRSQEELGVINRPNTLEDYRLAADMDALAQSSRRSSDAGIRQQQDRAMAMRQRQDEAIARRTDWESPSLVDEWGMTQDIRTDYEAPYDAMRRSLTDADLAQLTRQSEESRYGFLGSEVALDAATRANAVAREREASLAASQADQQTVGASVYGHYDQIRIDRLVEEGIEKNRLAELESEQAKLAQAGNLIKQADAVLASPVTSKTEKTAAATKRYGALSEIRRLEMQQRRIRSAPFYNAVTDPTATVYSKDVHTRVGLEKLNAYIASVAEKQFFNTRFNYTKHDPATTMKVQKAIERYDDIYGSWLNDMGKRNSKEINAKGFDLSKGAGYMGVNVIQGMFNKLGWAYHATPTEKMLRALKSKWGLGEDEPEGGLPIKEQETRCNERSGYKWDEETNTCIPISNLNTDYQDYLP